MFGVERQTYLGWCQNNLQRVSYFPVETYNNCEFTWTIHIDDDQQPLIQVFDAPESIHCTVEDNLTELFLDWKHPTESELQMVELSTGFNLEEPLKMLRELVDKK